MKKSRRRRERTTASNDPLRTKAASADISSIAAASTARGSLITTAIGGFFTLAVACTVYLADTAPSNLAEIEQAHSREAAEDGQSLSESAQYLQQANAIETRSMRRIDALKPYAMQIGNNRQPLSADTGNRLHLLSASSRLEAEKDKGILIGYSPSATYLPQEYPQLQVKSIADEITMWESLDALLEVMRHQGEKSIEAERAFDNWHKNMLEMQGDGSSIAAGDQKLLARVPDKQQEMNAKEKRMREDFAQWRRHFNWAVIGLLISLLSLGITFALAFSGKTEAKK